tara:strand:- start:23 stop:397 length:375 start_codon:yes stop_codon:yes gene_type:complete
MKAGKETIKAGKETIREFLLRGEKEESFLISDVAEHGCSGGIINELIYYYDTVKFHDEHEDEIWDELNTMADDFGYSIPQLIGSFNGSKHVGSMTQFKNLLSWWVCEVIAQRIMDEREQDKEVA